MGPLIVAHRGASRPVGGDPQADRGRVVAERIRVPIRRPFEPVGDAYVGDDLNTITGQRLGLSAPLLDALVFGFIAVVLAAVNIFGGFLVTNRMLAMFKKRG